MIVPFAQPGVVSECFEEIVAGLPLLEIFDEIAVIYESDPLERQTARSEFFELIGHGKKIEEYPYICVELLMMQAQAGLEHIGRDGDRAGSTPILDANRRLVARCLLLKCLSEEDIFVSGDHGFFFGVSNYFVLGLLESVGHLESRKQRSALALMAGIFQCRTIHVEIAPFAALACMLLRNRIDNVDCTTDEFEARLTWIEQYWNELRKALHVSGGLLSCNYHDKYKEQWLALFESWSSISPDGAGGEQRERARALLI
jgi:hypothetical protein